MLRYSILITGFLCVCSLGKVSAQSEQIFLERSFSSKYQRILDQPDVSFHSAIKPYLVRDVKKQYEPYKGEERGITKSLSLGKKLSVSFSPIVNLVVGVSQVDSIDILTNLGIGLSTRLKYAEQLTFQLAYSANRDQYPGLFRSEYLGDPIGWDGQIWHRYNKGYHSTDLNGYLSWNASDVFNFQLGHGRNFIGEGYRSLFLSDHAGNYSYGKITADIWRFKYVIIYSHLKDINNSLSRSYTDFDNKFATTHYLSWNVAKWLNIGLFESVVWSAKDTLLDRGFDPGYLNPIIFFRPVEYASGSSDNSLIGLSATVKPGKDLMIYSQIVLDEFLLKEVTADIKEAIKPDPNRQSGWWANKYGMQLGVKYHDVFSVDGLGLQAEFNTVRPFTYSHGNSGQNYGHLNRPLAHPMGANFYEMNGFVFYQSNNWYYEIHTQYGIQGNSTDSTNFGEQIFEPYRSQRRDYGNFTGQGINTNWFKTTVQVNYLVLPKSNLRLFASCSALFVENERKPWEDVFMQIGVRSNIYNRYPNF